MKTTNPDDFNGVVPHILNVYITNTHIINLNYPGSGFEVISSELMNSNKHPLKYLTTEPEPVTKHTGP